VGLVSGEINSKNKFGPVANQYRTYVGIAMRMCITFGFHREIADLSRSTFDVEMQRRVFWTCYILDRQISIATGRPFAISDQDIDTPV
jgi:Fungal specific transcription factor domain